MQTAIMKQRLCGCSDSPDEFCNMVTESEVVGGEEVARGGEVVGEGEVVGGASVTVILQPRLR